MATNRVGFRPFINGIEKRPEKLSLVVDSNVLIAYFDEDHALHEVVRDFLDRLDNATKVTYFTTVTTKSEFLEYQRRRLLTDAILSLNHEYKDALPISAVAKAGISTIEGRRNARKALEEKKSTSDRDHEFDIQVTHLSDREIKEAKKHFRATTVKGEAGWLKVCETFLSDKLLEQEALIDRFCEYLSPHKKEQADLFTDLKIDWKKATKISGATGMGYSDSLILNMFLHTNIPYLLTLDFDLIYAAAISAKDKTVLLPDTRISAFKRILKDA